MENLCIHYLYFFQVDSESLFGNRGDALELDFDMNLDPGPLARDNPFYETERDVFLEPIGPNPHVLNAKNYKMWSRKRIELRGLRDENHVDAKRRRYLRAEGLTTDLLRALSELNGNSSLNLAKINSTVSLMDDAGRLHDYFHQFSIPDAELGRALSNTAPPGYRPTLGDVYDKDCVDRRSTGNTPTSFPTGLSDNNMGHKCHKKKV